jgi:SAM-dependent methyltransferase
MPKRTSMYGDDLAYIHDAGFVRFANGCAPGLLSILRSARVEDRLVVDLGCGSGVWCEHLAKAGYRVFGIDQSSSMVAISRRRVPQAKFRVGSLWSAQLPKCWAITALGEVICYRPETNSRTFDINRLFQRVFESLESGGLFIFDVAEIGLDRLSKPAFFEGEDWTCLTKRTYDEKRHRLIREITSFRRHGKWYRRSTERHVLQLYQRQEIASSLRAVGFRVRSVRRFGAYPLLSGRVGFIARKA